MTLYIASDHAGFALKEKIKAALKVQKITVEDLGTNNEESVDYPDFAETLSRRVAQKPEQNKGILVCGTGIGMSIAANKVPGVRAAMIYDDFSAKAASEHNDANVACFGGRTQKIGDVKRWIEKWMKTPASLETRHRRRIDKITEIEEKNCC
ncbi:ribose 5-phosphate isomerase B [Candidatus Micrarchaeota archaeon]|nr:ribose 5-phosphate isomerase B [Candidatus Micrarchaeota archaeon]